jgi:hypothetical protein
MKNIFPEPISRKNGSTGFSENSEPDRKPDHIKPFGT